MNNYVAIGRLTADPKLSPVGSTKVCNFSIAINESRKVDDKWVDNPIFVECEAWDTGAESLANRAKKGNLISIVGKLKQERWEKDGAKHSKLKVRVGQFQVLTPKEKTETVADTGLSEGTSLATSAGAMEQYDDIPF